VARIIIAELVADDALNEEIVTGIHPLMLETVRQTLIYAKDVRAAGVEDEERGRRVMAEANLQSQIGRRILR
jgi:hypothetical protein